ncbi:hypothetical protein ACH5RR_026084 [Cinchona calisaya]|uniref:Uncharacterized protein n=1 Tax=Cinchona calisaya TaxID=153742 RepID=A0ABD2Z4R0_9GENT
MDVKRKQNESFEKYVCHWRKLAIKVGPPMSEREMVKAFIRTLEELFHERLLGLVNHRFSKVVEQGEMIEQDIKSGKFTVVSKLKVLAKRKTKGKGKKDMGSIVIERGRFKRKKPSRSRKFHYFLLYNLLLKTRSLTQKGHVTDNCHALHHEVQDLIGKSEFKSLMDVEQAYDPSMNMISVEESLDNPLELIIPKSEIIEKFNQMHFRLKGKAITSDESKPIAEMVTRVEFLRLQGKLKNMQLVNEILWDRTRAIEEKMDEWTGWEQSNTGIFGYFISEEVPTPIQSQCVATNVTSKTKKDKRILTPQPLMLIELFQHL